MQSPPKNEIDKGNKTNTAVQFIYKWVGSNIFNFRMWDAVFYLILYILVPVVITWVSLDALNGDVVAAVYCYCSIMVSAASSLYDAIGRFEVRKKSVRNIKLRVILFGSSIALGYGIFQFFAILISRTLEYRNDAILSLYLLAVVVALIDVFAVFAREDYMRNAVKD